MAVIPLTAGYIYILESNGATNQNWVPGGASTIDLTTFTEGTEYCKLEMPKKIVKGWSTGVQVMDPGGGGSVQINWDKRVYTVQATGIETSIANAEKLDQFTMLASHTGETSYIPYYLVIPYAATYVMFTDFGGTRRDYCKGVLVSGSVMWLEQQYKTAIAQFSWRSLWDAT